MMFRRHSVYEKSSQRSTGHYPGELPDMKKARLRRSFFHAMPFVIISLLLSGCAGLDDRGKFGSALTVEKLKNAEYPSAWAASGTARLKNGQYREIIIEGAASEIIITLSDKMAFGKLGGETEVAAVILNTETGGTGTFADLAVVVDRQGGPEVIASRFIGDRVRVDEISIENGKIVLHMLTHGPDDPMCCPTLDVTQTYELHGDRLVQVPVGN